MLLGLCITNRNKIEKFFLVELALIVVCLLFFLWVLSALTGCEAAAQTNQPKIKVACLLQNYPVDVVDATTGKAEEIENWVVTCKVSQADKVFFDDKLILPYPTSFQDAMVAVQEFRTKKAAIIVKQQKEKKE